MEPTKSIKVLIALDYDKTALKVAEIGYALAKRLDAEIVLLHVMSDPIYYASTEYIPIMGLSDSTGVDPLQFEGNDRLKKVSQHFLENIKHHLGDESIVTILAEGDFADSILMTAKESGTDILVMGSHSHRWLEDLVLGSVTNKVIRQTSIPVYIVPTKKRD